MAGLPNNTFMSPGVSFYATAGGSASTLQSPVAIVPDGSGNTTLAANASGVAGGAVLSAVGSANVPGGPGSVIVGGFGTSYRMGVTDVSGVLRIGINSSAYPAIAYDSQNTHQLILGDRSALASASIQTNLPFVVRDYAIDNTALNGVSISEDSTTQCTIANACANSGLLRLGSSQAFTNTLVVSDVAIPSPLTANYVQVNGTPGQVPLVINGAQGSGGGCGIYPNSASGITSSLNLGASSVVPAVVKIRQSADVGFVDVGGNGGQSVRLQGTTAGASVQTAIVTSDAGIGGQLSLGGSSGSANNILISDTTATFDQQIVQQVAGAVTYQAGIVLAAGSYPPGNYDFPIGTNAPGLYMIMMRVNPGSEADAQTLANMSSGFVYLASAPPPNQATTIVVGGGTMGTGNANLAPVVIGGIGASSIRLNVGALGGTLLMSIKLLPLLAPIPLF
jgi:hypothetical protein